MVYRTLIICSILLITSAFIAHASKPEITPIRESLSGFPGKIGEWQEYKSSELDLRVLEKLGVDDYINRVYYNREQSPASLYIGYYESQREGDTIHSPMNCLPGSGWNPAETGLISIPIGTDSSIEINRIIIIKGIEKQLVLYWYQSHSRVIASEYWGKIYTVLDALRTNRTDAALVRIVCPIEGLDAEAAAAAEKRAVDFVTELFPSLGRFLPE